MIDNSIYIDNESLDLTAHDFSVIFSWVELYFVFYGINDVYRLLNLERTLNGFGVVCES